MSLLATALLEPGDTVLVESPCYLAALQAFGFAGARVVAVPGDEDGIDPEALAELVLRSAPSCSTPSPPSRTPPAAPCRPPAVQPWPRSPAGAGCGSSRTTRTASCVSRASGCRGSPPTAGPGTGPSCSKSFSKVVAPGLRLGWLRGPAELRRACGVAKQAADLHTPTVNQLAAARYLADRDLDAHVTRVAAAYGARRDAMLAGLADALPAGSAWTRPEGGMFLWARLPGGTTPRPCSPGGPARRRVRPRRPLPRR